MASIFTYQEEPPRVHSPWSTPGQSTPQKGSTAAIQHAPDGSYFTSITKLEPERQDGPTEYKLHILLRPRRKLAAIPTHVSAIEDQSSRVSSSDSISAMLAIHTATALAAVPVSNHARQARLQQLTTQLLWRLQQSSPFHSSSNASLVLPVLPEATPKLSLPDRPTKLLPGLEESQGALYEIGVADDGTLVGLIEEELDESLSNLRAMAASLGCVVDVLRRVLVSQNGSDGAVTAEVKLWAAEVLVKPDTSSRGPPLEEINAPNLLSDLESQDSVAHMVSHESTEQIRVAVTGASASGKSSLVGTLTTSTLDNGRGKSRLSLLKHRHEIASGITSSVAQELIGYRKNMEEDTEVVNYASGDVSAWPDIHNLSQRLVFLSDSPGLPRYAKSTFRTMVSWKPHWTLFCVPADADDGDSIQSSKIDALAPPEPSFDTLDVALAHLIVALKLGLQLVVVVTRMDVATKTGLKTVLAKVLSVLKNAGRTPMILGTPSSNIESTDEMQNVAYQLPRMTDNESKQLRACLGSVTCDSPGSSSHVPIVLTSSVSGAGFGKLHGLLRELPATQAQSYHAALDGIPAPDTSSVFHIDEIFAIPPSKVYHGNASSNAGDLGIVLCGHVANGALAVGDVVRLGPFWIEQDTGAGDGSNGLSRHCSYPVESGRQSLPRSLSVDFSKSLQGEKIKVAGVAGENVSAFIDVMIVSLRSLRLPVRHMKAGETGTVGVQPVDQSSPISLNRARKGMVLISAHAEVLNGCKAFTAIFEATEFAGSNSPPLILGGHAIVYLNSIRAAVKVTAVRLDETDPEPLSPSEVFSFDGDSRAAGDDIHGKQVRVTFKFVSSVEWIEESTQVLVVPNVTAAGPISGPPNNVVTGLSGFVGKVCETFT